MWAGAAEPVVRQIGSVHPLSQLSRTRNQGKYSLDHLWLRKKNRERL